MSAITKALRLLLCCLPLRLLEWLWLQVSSFLVTNLHNSSVKWFSRIDQLAETAAATERYLATKAAKASERVPESSAVGEINATAQVETPSAINGTEDAASRDADGRAEQHARRSLHAFLRKQW